MSGCRAMVCLDTEGYPVRHSTAKFKSETEQLLPTTIQQTKIMLLSVSSCQKSLPKKEQWTEVAEEMEELLKKMQLKLYQLWELPLQESKESKSELSFLCCEERLLKD